MKNLKATMIALVLGSAVFSLTGCEKNETSAYGKAVLFHCASGSNGTKAAYSGDVTSNVERIDWEDEDLIRIYCAEASKPDPSKFADYKISNVTTNGSISEAKIAEKDGNDGLCWGETKAHNFYAVYPSPATSSPWVSSISGKTVTGTVKAAQTGEGTFSDGMVLVANKTVDNPTTFDKDAVFLEFQPITTAIKFSITNGQAYNLDVTKVELKSDSHPLSGQFSYNIGEGKVQDPSITDEEKEVSVTKNQRLTADKANTYEFTFLLRPDDDLNDLSLVITTGSGTYTSLLQDGGGAYTFTKGSKTVITGVVLEKFLTLTGFASFTAVDLRDDGKVEEEILF